MAIKKEVKIFRREYIPLVIAVLVLALLIVALVFTIINKPKKDEHLNIENSLQANDLNVDNTSNICEGYDTNELIDEAKKIVLSYEEIDNYYYGVGISMSEDVNKDGVLDDKDLVDVYGYAIRVKINGLTDKLKVIITNKDTKDVKVFTKEEYDKNGYAYDEGDNADFNYLDVKVVVNKEECESLLLRQFEITLPRFNEISKFPYCEDDEYKNTEICRKFTLDDEDFMTEFEKLQKQQKKSLKEREEKEEANKKNESDKNKKLIIYVSIIVIIIVGVVCVIIMRGRKKHE